MSESSSSSGIGMFGMLTVLFIGLKLADIITWSWWWVLSPWWISGIIILISMLFILLMGSLAKK